MTANGLEQRLMLVEQLLAHPESLDDVARQLRNFAWDFSGPGVLITRAAVCNAIALAVNGALTSDQLERWANAIECRDDIEYPDDDPLREVIDGLSNPIVHGDLEVGTLKRLLSRLDSNLEGKFPY